MIDLKKIALGSTSEHKLMALKNACINLGLSFEIIGLKTKSGQNEQPIGLDETFAGALTRAKSVQKKYSQDIAIGIESGIISTTKSPLTSLDLAVVVLLYGEDMIVTTSSGMVFPQKYFNIAKRKGFKENTVGGIIASKLGGDATDPHLTLSNGLLSRQETITKAIEIALRLLFSSKSGEDLKA